MSDLSIFYLGLGNYILYDASRHLTKFFEFTMGQSLIISGLLKIIDLSIAMLEIKIGLNVIDFGIKRQGDKLAEVVKLLPPLLLYNAINGLVCATSSFMVSLNLVDLVLQMILYLFMVMASLELEIRPELILDPLRRR